MESLIRYFVSRHLLVNIFAVGMIVLGYVAVSKVQREFIPSFDTPILWITARLPGASARDIETKITIPLEDAIADVGGIDEYHTTISDNTSFTTVELFDDYDADQISEAKQDLREAIDSITSFPTELEDQPSIKHLNPAQSPVLEVNLSGPSDSVNAFARVLEQKIERLDAISSVDTVGMDDPEIKILVDPAKIREHGITLQDIIAAAGRRNVSSTGGVLKRHSDNRQVVMWSRFDDPADVGDTILTFSDSGAMLRIKDVARIERGFEDNRLRAHTNGLRGITLLANKRESADIIDAANAVRSLVASIPAPVGIDITITNDESFRVANRLSLIATNGLIGGLLVAITLFFFLRTQPALWIVTAIPVVFFAALAALEKFGLTLNFATLSGFILVLGMVVDDAVVVSERIVYQRSKGLSAHNAAVLGTTEMTRPVIAAALTTMLAFTPVLALGGLPGKIAWQIPFVVILVLLLSLFEAFFILPAHMSTISNKAAHSKQVWIAWLEQRYRRLLLTTLRHRWLVALIAIGIFVLIMSIIRPLVPFVLFPQNDADRLFIKVSTPIGTPIEHTEAVVSDIERQLMQITEKDLEAVMSRTGHQETTKLTKQVGDADNEAVIILQFHKLHRHFTNVEWMPLIRTALHTPDNVKLVFLSDYDGPPTDQPVTIHVLSNDDADRRSTAFAVASHLRSTPGVTNVDIDERPGMPQIDLNLNYEKLALLGLDAETVGYTLNAAFYGIRATEHRDIGVTTDIRVMLESAARASLDDLLEIPLIAKNGSLVHLRDIVHPLETPSVTRIYHRNGLRSATIRANFSPGSKLTALSFARQLESELFPRFLSMDNLEIYNGGEAADTKRTAGDIGAAALIAVFSIGVVIWLMLGSLLKAAFILIAIPFAVAGVLLIFFLHGQTFSMFAAVGTIGLCGVVVNASIVMMDSIHRATHNKPFANHQQREHAAVDAIVERLRPILITSITTLVGVLPSAYGIGGYDTFVANISLAIGWGLVFSTLVTLFLVPVLYSLADEFGQWAHSIQPKKMFKTLLD